jgi:hypothetical protein
MPAEARGSHDVHESFLVFERLALPPLTVTTDT